MRIALISDPHRDLVALLAVISDIERQTDLDEVLVGGDLAQGGPQPADAVDEIRRRGWPSVRGNSDDFLVQVADGALRSPELPEALITSAIWSAGRLGSERIDYLRSLPIAIERNVNRIGRVVLVHATPWTFRTSEGSETRSCSARGAVAGSNDADLAPPTPSSTWVQP